MRLLWGNRIRNDHGHRSNVTTTGTRIITTNDDRHRHRSHGHGHHHSHQGTATVVAVPATHVSSGHIRGTHVSTSHGHHRYYHGNPSAIHGFWNKMLGTLTGNRRRRRHGDREIRKAREERIALRNARRVRHVHHDGHMAKLRKFRPHRRHGHHHDPAVITQDSGRRRYGETPWLHHPHRTLPPYHGLHHRILGFFSRGGERRAKGTAMFAAAETERRRERRHRGHEVRDLGRRYREGRSGDVPFLVY